MSTHPTPTKPVQARGSSADRGRPGIGPRKAQTVRRQSVAPILQATPAPIQPGGGPVRRADLLAAELGNGRISQAQYLVGRMIQAVFERGSGARLGTADWGAIRASGGTAAQDLAVILRIEDAERINRFTARLEAEIGRAGTRFLRSILAEGHSFKSYAAARGQGSELGIRSVAERFRWLLEALTEAHTTATGPDRSAIRGGPTLTVVG